MKKIILGIILIAISGVIAWNGTEWADGQQAREIWLVMVGVLSFLGGYLLIAIYFSNNHTDIC